MLLRYFFAFALVAALFFGVSTPSVLGAQSLEPILSHSVVAAPRVLAGEACPARMGSWKMQKDDVVALNLRADRSREVGVTLGMQTDSGWYSVRIPPTTMLEWPEHFHTSIASWSASRIQTAPIYVRLPVGATKLLHAWVIDALVTTASDPWYSVGRVSCSISISDFGDMLDQSKTTKSTPFHVPDFIVSDITDTSLDTVRAANVAPLETRAITALSDTCKSPFLPASAARVAPVTLRGVSILTNIRVDVLVTLGTANNIISARVYRPAGNKAVDASALAAAFDSAYRSATAFCKPAVGRYLFQVDYVPGEYP